MKKVLCLGLAFAMMMLCMPNARAAEKMEDDIKIIDGVQFSKSISQAVIDSLDDDMIRVLRQEFDNTIVSIRTIDYYYNDQGKLVPISAENTGTVTTQGIIPSSDFSMTVVFGDKEDHYGYDAYQILAIGDYHLACYWGTEQYIGLSWKSNFELIAGTQKAYTYFKTYNHSGFDYNCSEQGGAIGNGIWFGVNGDAADTMIMIAAKVYATSKQNSIWASCSYMRCESQISIDNVSFTVGTECSFSVTVVPEKERMIASGYNNMVI